jgi:hypothetical protein
MAVALYLRVSTEEQRERQSIATQNDFALRYCSHTRVNVRVGTQNYAINITAQATILPSEPARPVQQLRMETRYLRLSAPVAFGDRIDGWRVCWLGGWDRGKVCFVVMVERVTRAPGPQ